MAKKCGGGKGGGKMPKSGKGGSGKKNAVSGGKLLGGFMPKK